MAATFIRKKLSQLLDVGLSSPGDGQALIFNSSSGKWSNGNPTTTSTDGSPWSTTVASSVSAGATSLQIKTAQLGITTGKYIIVGAWTASAELKSASVSSTTVTVSALANDHAVGSQVILVEDHLNPDWFGALPGSGNATANTAAFNALIGACGSAGGWKVLCSTNQNYYFTGQLVLGAGIRSFDLGFSGFNWTSDLGTGLVGIWVNNQNTPGMIVRNGTLTGPAANAVAGNRGTDPACMDGVLAQPYTNLNTLRIQNFRSGVREESGYNHGNNIDLSIGDCYYGIYRHQNASTNKGDNRYLRCNINNNRMASVATATGQTRTAESFTDCHFYGSPFAFYNESGGAIQNIIFHRCSFESIGDAGFYVASGGGGIVGPVFDATTSFSSWDAANFGISGFSGTKGVFVNDSGGDLQISLTGNISGCLDQQTAGGPPFLAGTSRWLVRSWDTDLGNAGPADWNLLHPSFSGPAVIDQGSVPLFSYWRANGYPNLQAITVTSGGTVKRGDLLEYDVSAGPRPYQTSGRGWLGIALEADPGLAGSTTNSFFYVPFGAGGSATINVHTGVTIAAQSWVKPDLSNPGCVIAASGPYDSTGPPVIGFTIGGNNASSTGYGSTNTVQVNLL